MPAARRADRRWRGERAARRVYAASLMAGGAARRVGAARMRTDQHLAHPVASEWTFSRFRMSTDGPTKSDGLESAWLDLVLAVTEGDSDVTLALCVAALATLLVLATCCAIRLQWRISHMQSQARGRRLRVVPTDGESERSRLHPKKGRQRHETASPSAEQDFADEDESA